MTKAKSLVGLDCDANASEGIKLLLHTRFEELCELRQSALDWSDIEGVHDMRVASRRLRSALRDFKPYLKRRKYSRASDAIKQIADSLGAVRDKDVAITALEKLSASAPPDVAFGIELFASERRSTREIDRAALVGALADDLRKIRAEFDASLESAFSASPSNGNARVSFRAIGQKIIKSRMDEVRGYSSSLYQPLITKPLHRMRIAAKRLRYAIELFAPCWDSRIYPFAKEVAALQTSLGELHDCDLWIAEFGELLRRLDNRVDTSESIEMSDLDKQKRQAAVWLLSHFTKRRTSQYRDSLARWYKWDTSDFFRRVSMCIEHPSAAACASNSDISITDDVDVGVHSRATS